MISLDEAATEFLRHRRIAIAGVSREKPNAANGIYRRLRTEGYIVYAVNPEADIVEGDRCYHSILDIADALDGVIIGTHPERSRNVVASCILAAVPRVWFHHTFGAGSYDAEAVKMCEDAGIAVIAGGCPMMFLPRVDAAHRCFKWVFTKRGKLPRQCNYDVRKAHV